MKIIKQFLFILLFCMLSFSCENQFEQKKSKPGYGTISFNLNCERTVQENLSDAIFEQFMNIALYSKTADSLQKWEEISAPIKNWSNYEAFSEDANVSIKIGTYDFLLVAFIGDGENNDTKFVSEIKNVQINVTDNETISFSMKITDCGTENGFFEVSFSLGERIGVVNFIKYTLKKVTYTAEGRQTEDYREITFPNEEIEEITEDLLTFHDDLPAGIYDLTARFETNEGEGLYKAGEVAEYSTTISVSENLESNLLEPIIIDKFNPFSRIRYEIPDFINITDYERPQKISVYDELLPEDLPVLQKDGYDFKGWYTSPNPVEETKFTGIPKYSFYDDHYDLYACFEREQQDQQQYLLFSKMEDVTRYNLCMTADLTTEPTLQPIHIGPLQGFTVGGNENFYYMENVGGIGDILNSSDNTWRGALTGYGGNNLVSLYYDYESKIMYGMPESFNYLNFYEKDGDADRDFLSFYQIVADMTPIMDCPKYDFAVNKEALYIAYKNADDIYMDKFDIDKETPPLTCTHYITNEISFYGNEYLNSILTSEDFTITDMICLNENLYIAWKYSPTQGYQTDDGSIEFASFGGIFCMNEDLSRYDLYNIGFIPTEEEERPYTVRNESTGELQPFNYLGADSIDDKNSFFGPTKFIAYESNKLIFADEGVFVSQEDGDNSASFENVNRIVEIDLSNINPDDGTFIDVDANVIKTVSNNVTFETEFQELQVSENCIINKQL